ncbi:hypothetical protein OK18_11320 [Chryseobacterium gallinarum]|uniref:Lipoprotein n=1 Tax=Chryseobacterium gallinarum TaxID=1324352 RepID=A0A0G3M2P6_CHRGL|nr:hypothetical protein [Chryseobacterium gallinarum]AKK73124.1 hypothetical protein OK18_11320 [Chryseobacterium gallinarum]
MKKSLFIILIIFFSCVDSNTEFLPKNISEAVKEKLLIAEYKPNTSNIKINENEYIIEEAFTTFKYISKNNKNINKNFFAFVLKIKDIKSNNVGLSLNDQMDYDKYINFYCDNCGGIDSDNIVVIYNNLKTLKTLDTIKIGFKDKLNKEKLIIFKKNK